MKITTKQIVYVGIFSALVLIGTYINIVLPFAPQGGLIHFGTTVSVIAIIVGGKKIGTLSGTIGMTLFDVIGGWLIWAPATFIARLGLGYIMGSICELKKAKDNKLAYTIVGLILGGVWMILTYYVYEVIIYQNPIAALGSILANILQLVLAAGVGIPLGLAIQKYVKIDK